MKKILSGLGIMLLTAGIALAGEKPDFSKIQSAVKEKFPEKYEEIMKTAQSDICKARRDMMMLAKEAGVCPQMKGKPVCRKPKCKPDCPKGECSKCECPECKDFRPGYPDCKARCPEAKDCKAECPEMQGCPPAPGCEKAGAPCPKDAGGCPKKFAPKHKLGGDLRGYIKAQAELREKCPAEMLELDKKIIAVEDEMYALAKANGIELPRKKADIRRIRVAFPEELKQLEADRKNLPPREFGKKLGELAEKLNQK